MPDLVIRNLHANITGTDTELLKGIDLQMSKGEIHAIMGPNGSGKSTLSHVLMGHPGYEVTEGEVLFEGQNLLDLAADQRSRAGLFLSFQYPFAVPGVTVANFIRMAVNAHRKGGPDGVDNPVRIPEFRKQIQEAMELLEIDKSMASRSLNDGFSGGEKKRFEILQMAMLQPKIAILDETDSGLDIDALRIVAEGVNAMRGPDTGFLVITHYQRLLEYIVPDRVHIMWDGRIVHSGGKELALELEAKGYDWVKTELASA